MAAGVDVADVGLDLDDSPCGAAADEQLVEELGCDLARVALVEGARKDGAWGGQGEGYAKRSTASPNASLTPSGVSKGSFSPRRTLT